MGAAPAGATPVPAWREGSGTAVDPLPDDPFHPTRRVVTPRWRGSHALCNVRTAFRAPAAGPSSPPAHPKLLRSSEAHRSALDERRCRRLDVR